ncbi:MAG: hypothetical protein WC076_12470, partial [Terrimicrobiaceae bacterium]
ANRRVSRNTWVRTERHPPGTDLPRGYRQASDPVASPFFPSADFCGRSFSFAGSSLPPGSGKKHFTFPRFFEKVILNPAIGMATKMHKSHKTSRSQHIFKALPHHLSDEGTASFNAHFLCVL